MKRKLTKSEKASLDNLQDKLKALGRVTQLLSGKTDFFKAKNIMLAKLESVIREELPKDRLTEKETEKFINTLKERVLSEILGAV